MTNRACACGCGQDPGTYATTERGHRKGDPRPYVFNHQFRGRQIVAPPPAPNPSGLCMCGCGQPAPIAKTTVLADGIYRGQHRRFISGHNAAGRPLEPLETRYEIRDCGYETPCWVWQRTRSRKGYGRMWDPARGRIVQASRYFYEHFVEPIPDDLQLDHLCRNPPCVNPSHLEPVTNTENNHRGVAARIPDATVDAVRELAKTETNISQIARLTGVSHPTVKAIVSGSYWR